MKKLLSTLVLLLIVASVSEARCEENKEFWQEQPFALHLNLGLAPLIGAYFDNLDNYWHEEPNLDYGNSVFQDVYPVSMTEYPSLNLGFSYRILKWFSIKTTLSYVGYEREYRDIFSGVEKHFERGQAFSALAAARFHWFSSESVSLYSSFGLGAAYCSTKSYAGLRTSEYRGAVSFNFIGAEIGRKLFGSFELGLGTTGCLKLGLGYKFK